MRRVYYECDCEFRTVDIEDAKSYTLKNGYDFIRLYNDDLVFIGFLEYDKKDNSWHREYC